ncbi:cysteine hydrolase family protein [Cupriavidus sp. YAF13]|uniref:cysteine hydrolase family protein n=1 Tax=Cupriavidus sp. YAF13 TaxID=3233075 RepID=UPI003F92ACCE
MQTALIVIDVQRGLFDDAPRPGDADAVLGHINGLTARARAAGVPVVFVQHEQAGGALSFGSPGWELERTLVVAADDHRVRKTTPDSFLHTELAALLDRLRAKHLVICGYATEFCVDTTVRRAAGLGYSITLAADAHTTHDKPHASAELIRRHHNATLPAITSFGRPIRALASEVIGFGGGAAGG